MFQAKVPPLPSHYISRPEVIGELKQSLFSPSQTGVWVVSAIYGLGGIGKSTVAAALARDPEVLSHFPDGVLWATLGQQPDLLSFLNSWIQALGDYDYKPTTPEAASEHLRTLLADKAALLVVDDVWDAEHFDFFRVGSAECRVLATTRSAAIGGASRLDLDVMEPHQALELLRRSLGGAMRSADEQLALTLAAEVGYLPLALELAAAQVVSGVSWSQLLADITREVAALETLDLSTDARESEEVRKGYSLLASLNLSLRQLPEVQLQRFAWLGVLPDDVSLTPEGMMTVWQLETSQAKETLGYLKSKALLLSGMTLADGTPTYRLHDLLHDLARRLLIAPQVPESSDKLPGLGLTLPVAHGQLLERYRAKTQQGLWHTVPDDGYIHPHLSWHLVQADRVDELHQLLQEETDTGRNGWYEACDRLGELPIFLSDVARAWQQADRAFESSPSRAIALQCRYALIMSSLNSLAASIPGELMAALVDKGVWTPAQGLAYARQVQDPEARASALRELAPHISENLLPEALATARAIQDEYNRAEALIALAPRIREILPEALDTVKAIEFEYGLVEGLCALAPHISESLLPEFLDTIRAIPDESRRVKVLRALVPHISESRLPEILDTARAIQNEYCRAEVFCALAPYISESMLLEIIDTVRAIQDEWCRAQAIINIYSARQGIRCLFPEF